MASQNLPPIDVPGLEEIETLAVPGVLSTPVHELDAKRDVARLWIAGTLAATFLLTAGWVLGTATFGEAAAWANTKEALQILLPVESSLLGSAVVFYFTGTGRQG